MTSGRIKGSVAVALCVAGLFVGGAIAFAQSSAAPLGITFPVQDLGNCASKEACHDYCELAEHMDACIVFAKAHGLMNKEEADRSEQFSRRMKEGKTPGNCTSPASCNAYCEDVTHLDECVRFAEAEGFKGEEYERGKKIRTYLKEGGTMPGGCTSRPSCEAYCNNFAHAEECYQFVESAGLGAGDVGEMKIEDGSSQKMTLENLKRLGELAQKGETPGGCTNKDACMAYCEALGHMEECVTFGEKVGIMKKEEVDRARKFMSKGGPGGCTSRESCDAFCNNSANQETCFKFAQENGLIPEKELGEMKEGWVRMRQGLENAPAEVAECLASTLGANVIENIQSGKLVPGPDIGERVRGCFEKFGADHRPQELFFEAPAEVQACLKEKFGETYEGIRSGKVDPTPEMADTFRVCFQQVEFERSNGWGVSGEMREGGMMPPNERRLESFLRSAPPEIETCLKEKLGERFEGIERGEIMPGPEMGEAMRACFESFRPAQEGGYEYPPTGEFPQGMTPPNSGLEARPIAPTTLPVGMPPPPSPEAQMMNFMGQFPSQTAMCIREKLGEEGFVKIAMEGRTPELESAIRICAGAVIGGDPTMFAPPPVVGGTVPPADTVFPSGLWTDALPLPIQTCLRDKFPDRYAQIGFASPTEDVEIALRACYTEVSGGNIQVVPFYPPPTMPPPPDTTQIQSRNVPLTEQLLGAVFVPFAALRHIFQ
ncbi:MAG: hypothetical protein A3C93_02345 [Candidatus Lloydbacteria bacterium RIFCSPHIGHO2_02_FULL_54_17]|uniref:Uncharacterized protein n=1 Tax=Candidatus Lloydbacteria bacterium RIFCSPHIGHO2_02_FULL_54_17 TaxID=1798664 RepID=A0A1G2DDY5_9BACT|nr:MAG: hypothetical protein A3C93_02345 [Candidatus Lloydbacteria bacterium RIFCSPHIGHO2_02_FULL_54_17]OGZ14282.1 MAG: hypothetical protein A2948_01680 [Candidatus Lloydbacteria bacterium RIFCSPLOWO2_01_FULL_54_18]